MASSLSSQAGLNMGLKKTFRRWTLSWLDRRRPAPDPDDPGLFRFGFLAHRRSTSIQGDGLWRALEATWPSATLGQLIIRTHPETELAIHRLDDGTEIAVIGAMFAAAPEAPTFSPSELAADPPAVLRNLTGRFAILVARADGVTVFNDAFGSRSIFYSANPATPAFASHSALLAHACGIEVDESVSRLVATREYRDRTVRYLPGDLTLFDRVFALVPNNSLHFPSMETRRYWPSDLLKPATFDDFFDEISALHAATAEHFRGRFFPIFGITGGIDSRSIYAAWTKAGIPFGGFTWSQPLKRNELPIIDAIVTQLSIPHTYLKLPMVGRGVVPSIAAVNSGGYRIPSGIAEAMHGQYGRSPKTLFIRGLGGEIVRGFYNRVHPITEWTPRRMAGAYGVKGNPEFGLSVEAAFENFFRRANYQGVERFGFDIDDLFYWEHRMGMWGAATLNEMDPVMFSVMGINSRRVYETAMGLPSQERLTKQILHRVVERYDPALAAIPVI
jgi:hypothetical protein